MILAVVVSTVFLQAAAAQPLSSPVQGAGPSLTLSPGFSGLYRPGSWIPLYLTVTSTDQRVIPATAELHAYQDARGSVVLSSPLAVQPGTHTYILPLPMGYLEDAVGASIRETTTGRVLVSATLPATTTALTYTRGSAATPTRLAVIASPSNRTRKPFAGDIVAGSISTALLPDIAELYDSVDLVILAESTLEELTAGQAAAIVSHIQVGGRVLVIPPVEGLSGGNALGGLIGSLRKSGNTAGNMLEIFPVGLGSLYVAPQGALSTADADPLGKILASLPPVPLRLSLEYPPVAEEQSSGLREVWLRVVLPGAAVFLLLLGPVEAITRRSHNRWPWTRPVALASILVVPVAVAAIWFAQESKKTESRMTLHDTSPASLLATSTLTNLASSQPVPGLVKTLEPMRTQGTAHSLTRLNFANGATATLAAPERAMFLTSHTAAPGAATPISVNVSDAGVTISAPPEEALIETPVGIYVLTKTGDTIWTIPQAPTSAVLPEAFGAAQRLTPLRSAQLQQHLRSEPTARILWTRTGTTFTRTLLP